MKENKIVNILLGLIIVTPVALNLWKFLGRDYTVIELLPHLLLDFSVVALFFFLAVSKPLEKPVIYWSPFIWFCIVYLAQHTPDSIVDWIANIFVLGFFGFYIFPIAAVRVMPYVLVGLFISYFLVLRFMLFNMNYSEAQEILLKKNPTETAKEFIHILAGYERNMLGREKYRYFLHKDADFRSRLDKATILHDQIFPSLQTQKISYLEWQKAYSRESGFEIEISSQSLTGISTEKDTNDYPIPCKAKVEPFPIKLIQLEDKSYRVVDFPEKIITTRIE